MLNTEQVNLLEKTADRIVAHPGLYDQATFTGRCCCIAGHLCIVAGKYTPEDLAFRWGINTVYEQAKEILGLDDKFTMLFTVTWMNELCQEYHEKNGEWPSAQMRAEFAYAYIMRYILENSEPAKEEVKVTALELVR